MSSPKPAQQGGETSCCTEASLLAGVALLSAFVTSCFTIVIQLTQAIGVIVDSEAYEQPDAPGNSTGHAGMAVAEEVWAPADGAERNVCTWLADMLILFAFSLMLVGLYHALNRPVGGLDGIMDMKATLWGGVVWGAGGFVVFGAAPGLGLPPELPGMHAAPLHHRQGWWVMTALATFCGLALMTTGRTLGISEPRFLLSRAGGLALMVLPQLIGPPDYMHTMGAGDRPPPEMAAHFVIVALMAQGLSWFVLGICTALGYNQYFKRYGDSEALVAEKREMLTEFMDSRLSEYPHGPRGDTLPAGEAP